MSEYQVLARRYRPQKFSDVVAQEAVVTTLLNAIRLKRVAHAYLFSGPRGTGKTTLARLLAKALSCPYAKEGEPCNECSNCQEITSGQSLDVIEIDGASNRGIEEIRKINETVGFSAAGGKYRIYIIDEVHMLTKEAFNALLKTLEEPPPNVKFFFATTEPHKVLPTIISRCQRFALRRIPTEQIIAKLLKMSQELNISIEKEALRIIANQADGGMRDAESLLDQMISFHEGTITESTVAESLGIMPSDSFFLLDQAGKNGDLKVAFNLVTELFEQGKDLFYFVDTLLEHFRNLLAFQMGAANLDFSKNYIEKLQQSAKLYHQEQLLSVIDDIIETQKDLRQMQAPKIALEALLLRILRSHARVPVDFLVSRLTEMEENLQEKIGQKTPPVQQTGQPCPPPVQKIPDKPPAPLEQKPSPPVVIPPVQQTLSLNGPQESIAAPPTDAPPIQQTLPLEPPQQPIATQQTVAAAPVSPVTTKPPARVENTPKVAKTTMPAGRIDTILQFSAIELGGTLEKKMGTKM